MSQATEITKQGQETNLPAQYEPWIPNIPLAMTFNELLSHDDAPDETADDIIHAVREWRGNQEQRSYRESLDAPQ